VDRLGPGLAGGIAQAARSSARSVAFTYNDPVIFAEYAMDVADACHAAGVQSVAVTAGYIHDAPRRAFFAQMDAANVDLKGLHRGVLPRRVRRGAGAGAGHAAHIHHETRCWLEITTLLIPGAERQRAELTALTRWVARRAGARRAAALHRLPPRLQAADRPATPLATVQRARRIARDEGLHYVYTGNVHDAEGGTTHCPRCNEALIVRDWHQVTRYRLHGGNLCPRCDFPVAGRFEALAAGQPLPVFGRQRIPVSFSSPERP
jgi:pyruvate formate lyase activating enzyme